MSDNGNNVVELHDPAIQEERILFNDPHKVIFGGKEYLFRKPSMRRSREWRGKLIKLIGEIKRRVGDFGDDETATLTYLNQEYTEEMIALIIDYVGSASGLTKELIDDEGTDDELVVAWKKVSELGRFPFDQLRLMPTTPTGATTP